MKRYKIDWDGLEVFKEVHKYGEWVKYSDVEGLIEALKWYAKKNNHNNLVEFVDEKDLNDPEVGHFVNADDFEYYDCCFTPGKKAREALKKAGVEC